MRVRQFLFVFLSFLLAGCTKSSNQQPKELSQEFKDYWYKGEAEITSFQLEQARYGELREGRAVQIFVTEPFSSETFTKADERRQGDQSVLKLNFTKNFTTGIYPYSLMQSTFFPLETGTHSLKETAGVQEWCGQVFMELLNKDQFEIGVHSYFQGENEQLTLEKTRLEDDVWSIIRINPDELPVGELEFIPSFFYLRLKHKKVQAYQATATLLKKGNETIYTIDYPRSERTLIIEFETTFPHKIISWEETYPDGKNGELMKTTASRLASVQTDYWTKNSLEDESWRKKLKLN